LYVKKEMSNLNLVLSNIKYKNEYLEFIEKCYKDIIETCFDSLIPLSNTETVENDIKKLNDMHVGKGLPDNWVPASTYWLMKNNNRIIGTINIRHKLNENLEFRGGHISYYIRPFERNRGYGTKMLSLALEHCRNLGIERVLITCNKDNMPSAKIIRNNGGIFYSEGVDDMQIIHRYWIKMS